MSNQFNNTGCATNVENIGRDLNIENYYNSFTRFEPEAIEFAVQIPEFPFIGRSEELSRLEDVIQTPSSIIVVSGLGGIGKTQLVRQYIDKNRSSYENIIWIDSHGNDSIDESFKRLARDRLQISITNENGKKQFQSIAGDVLCKLSRRKTLLVYDHVCSIGDIRGLLTVAVPGIKPHIIITSRIREGWGNPIKVIQLEVFKLDEAIEFVSTMLNSEDSYDETKELVEKLQYFPLALRQATADINYERKDFISFRICHYIEKCDTKDVLDSNIFQTENALNIYEKTTFSTWDCTIKAIEQDKLSGPLAMEILNIVAYLDEKNINTDFFNHLPKTVASLENNVRSAVRVLVNYSMVNMLAINENRKRELSILKLVQLVRKLKLQNINQEKQILSGAITFISKLVEHEKLHACHSHAISVFKSVCQFVDLKELYNQLVSHRTCKTACKAPIFQMVQNFLEQNELNHKVNLSVTSSTRSVASTKKFFV